MRPLILTIVISLMVLGLSTSALAQAPNITGAANYDSSHHSDFYYWSIYGSNLSSGTGNSEVYYTWYEGPPNDFNTNDWIGLTNGESNTFHRPTYWYESSSQINFYMSATTDPGYVLEYTGFLHVCDLNTSQCSNTIQWFFN